MQFWQDAVRFADLAGEAILIDGDLSNDSDDDFFEYNYLRGLTRRFRLTELMPAPGEPNRAIVTLFVFLRQQGAEAIRYLYQCIEHHEKRKQTLRELRSVSERAAVRLLIASRVAIWYHSLDDKDRRVADGHVADALGDLRRCILRGSDFAQEHLSKDRLAIFEKIQDQYFTNYCYANLLSQYFETVLGRPQGLRERDKKISSLVATRVSELIGNPSLFEEFPFIVKLDLLLYAKLFGSATDLDVKIGALLKGRETMRLEFDNELVTMLTRLHDGCANGGLQP
jgi:hypothetical protein